MFGKLHCLLNPVQHGALNKLDVPEPAATDPKFGHPSQPKSWSGPWMTLTNPDEIARVITSMNSAQYNQAFPTPFGSGPLANSMGRHGNTPVAQALLGGTLPGRELDGLLPETICILSTLATPCSTLAGTTDIMPDAFIATYKITPESTSSLPSGCHVGHYKAALSFPDLFTLHASMMSIPFQLGFTPGHWNKVVDIMLPKDTDHV